jgi:hypothetical protein
METELQRILDQVRQVLLDLYRIEVTLAERDEPGDEPGVTIEGFVHRPFRPGDQTEGDLGGWKVDTFPPRVCQHFAILVRYEGAHAG